MKRIVAVLLCASFLPLSGSAQKSCSLHACSSAFRRSGAPQARGTALRAADRLKAELHARAHSYKIVAAESSLWVFVAKAGFFSAFAHDHEIGVQSFNGSVIVTETGVSGGALELAIDARSLTVLDKKPSAEDKQKIRDAMHNEVLESAKYQKITFKSASVSNVKQTGENVFSLVVNGELTLHGVTKRLAVPASVTITPQQLRAVGKYTLKQTDFGIKPYSAAGGAVKVKNEVVVNFNIVAKA
jgi:polyisoprenoid-binding protein YceI